MLAAEALGRALLAAGIDTVFANPGTTELHLVRGFANVAGLRQIPTLFEGVASGAADGFGRVAGRPAAALLHLGPGLGNALANLHNARRARTPLLAIVGDHAIEHRAYDTPLQSDIRRVAESVSVVVEEVSDPAMIATVANRAIDAAQRLRGIATLIVPADIAWADIGAAGEMTPRVPTAPTDPMLLDRAVDAVRSGQCGIIVGGGELGPTGVGALAGIAAAAGVRVFTETFIPALARGGGLPSIPPLPYLGPLAVQALAGLRSVVLIGAQRPVSFFRYPGVASELLPVGVDCVDLPDAGGCLDAVVSELAARLGAAPGIAMRTEPKSPPTGTFDADAVGCLVAAHLPAEAIVVDEANTASPALYAATGHAARHLWLRLTGGAIGQGLPLACGAALAAPARKVLALQADGAALYTIHALWTQARLGLDVTTIILDNGGYRILEFEMERLGLNDRAADTSPLFRFAGPAIDFASLARGFGVPCVTAETPAQLAAALPEALAARGPSLIVAQLNAGA